MNIYSKYFTVEELHFHLWNEIYNFVDENWDKCETKDIPALSILKQEIIEEFKDKGVVHKYTNIQSDCFLCEEYNCYDCPLTRAYNCLCMNQNSFFSLALHYFYNCFFYGKKENKETVLLCIAKVRDCYSCLDGDC